MAFQVWPKRKPQHFPLRFVLFIQKPIKFYLGFAWFSHHVYLMRPATSNSFTHSTDYFSHLSCASVLCDQSKWRKADFTGTMTLNVKYYANFNPIWLSHQGTIPQHALQDSTSCCSAHISDRTCASLSLKTTPSPLQRKKRQKMRISYQSVGNLLWNDPFIMCKKIQVRWVNWVLGPWWADELKEITHN